MARTNVLNGKAGRKRSGSRPDAAPAVRTANGVSHGSPAGPAAANGARQDPRIRRLFESLREGRQETVSSKALPEALRRSGLRLDDQRLRETMNRLRELEGRPEAVELSYEQFVEVVQPNILVTERALRGAMAIPDFESFCETMGSLYEEVRGISAGVVADYIPQLSRMNPESFGVSICTVDGQRHNIGDAQVNFTLQSTSKPVSYALALEEHGEDKVHRHIGREPSGVSFNELTLNADGLPHNPMINAGAIMSNSLIKMGEPIADRFDHIVDTWQRLMGGWRPGFSNAVYLSERETADRNYALGYSMRERGAFPANTDLREALEFFFQVCAIEVNTESFAVMAASLANGGVCPTTGERVLKPETVRKVLSLMSSCGMYDFSGEWAFSIGLPAKSGVCGGVVVVVPNVLGMVIWSPPLDKNGNSVRGVQLAKRMVDTFNFHNFDAVERDTTKIDPRLPRYKVQSDNVVALCWAASKGDLTGIRRLVVMGADLGEGDYDGRTPMHLAASEGHRHVVDYFVSQGVELNPRDRWGGTPLDDAVREGHDELVELLEASGGVHGDDQLEPGR